MVDKAFLVDLADLQELCGELKTYSLSVKTGSVQIMGHSSLGILQTYAKAIDEYRRSAIRKLEALREAQPVQGTSSSERDDATVIQ